MNRASAPAHIKAVAAAVVARLSGRLWSRIQRADFSNGAFTGSSLNSRRPPTCAMRPQPRNQPTVAGRIGFVHLLQLALLLTLPAYALSRLPDTVPWRLLSASPIAVSFFTFLAYRTDKMRAQAGEWRIPEATLHFSELLGGWPGGFLAQRKYRHKTAKGSYQFVFWAIVLLHEYLAFDSLFHWKYTTLLFHFVDSHKR